ncbi:type VI secretion system protein ImpA [Pseudomonas congelans]|uniref:Type VI secretion system protein ImpA n=1 Tax=Pseudomonas congelans TaxID=200452 RepID=A0A1H0JNT9_9PSED|nr:type VI secretion system protein TssA [Pseudomonas congelans]SDO45149.1 type VI secretion system protein ImpA [Pseudomonas congelans]
MNQLSARVSSLLEPVSESSACGVSLRHDPVYDRLRQLRLQEDDSLPRGVWQADLKRADWSQLEMLASSILSETSKDLMVAAWLGEAWLHKDALSGIVDALSLVEQLCERYPEDLHPRPEEGDQSWRAPPLEWLTRRYAELLITRLPLFGSDDAEFAGYSLGDWRQMTRRQVLVNDSKAAKVSAEDALNEQKKLNQRVRSTPLSAWLNRLDAIQTALDTLARLEDWTERHLQDQAPTFGVLQSNLQSLAALFKEFIAMHPPQDLAPAPSESSSMETLDMPHDPVSDAGPNRDQVTARAFVEPRNREDAYRQLSAIADYLTRTEPHSPVPYLIKKGVEWGNQPLKELLSELISSDTEARRVWTLLGVL